MLRTTPPPDGMTQVWNFSVSGSKRTSVFGCTADSLYQMMSPIAAMPYGCDCVSARRGPFADLPRRRIEPAQVAARVVRVPDRVVRRDRDAPRPRVRVRQRIFLDLHRHRIDAADAVAAEVDVPRHALRVHLDAVRVGVRAWASARASSHRSVGMSRPTIPDCSVNHSVPFWSKIGVCGPRAPSGSGYSVTSPVLGSSLPM